MRHRFKRLFPFHRVRWQFTGDQHHTARNNEPNYVNIQLTRFNDGREKCTPDSRA